MSRRQKPDHALVEKARIHRINSLEFNCASTIDWKPVFEYFDEKDTVADRKIFCLTSPCTFSNANMVACMLKDTHKVTMMGRTSAGGSCEVLYASSAWGSSFTISSLKRSSFLKNGSFYDIDRGADPDYQISTPEKYYDRQALTDYINSLY